MRCYWHLLFRLCTYLMKSVNISMATKSFWYLIYALLGSDDELVLWWTIFLIFTLGRWTSVQYCRQCWVLRGGCHQYVGNAISSSVDRGIPSIQMFSTVGNIIRGYHQYIGGRSVLWGYTISAVERYHQYSGVGMSSVQYGNYNDNSTVKGYHHYIGVCSVL